MKGIIYRATCQISGKVYIGQTLGSLATIEEGPVESGGFLWTCYTNDYPTTIDTIAVKVIARKSESMSSDHSVIQMDREGNELKTWKNEYQASLGTGDSLVLIRKMLNGIPAKKSTKYLWKRSDTYNFRSQNG